MIKKILLSLGLIGIGLINFSFGYTLTEHCFLNKSNSNDYYNCYDLDLGEEFKLFDNVNGINNTINNGFSFYSDGNYLRGHRIYGTDNKVYNIFGFFNDLGLYNFVLSAGNSNNNSDNYKLYSGFNYCLLNNITSNSDYYKCGADYCNYNPKGYISSYNEAINLLQGEYIQKWRLLVSDNNYYYFVCGVYSNNKAICVPLPALNSSVFSTYSCYSGVQEITTNYRDVNDIINNLDEFGLSESPFIDFGGLIPENGFPNTNRGVFDSYAEQGYVLSRCYSDFSLDNLATATGGIDQFYDTELDDGVYYTGATVLDLFVEYGYGNSFESFFDYWYQTYYQSIINNSPVKYVGLSKGLWNMSNKYYYAGLSNKYVDYTKFYNYCSYFVNFDGDWDAEYTGPQLSNDVANQLAPSQSAIDYLSGFLHSQNSGSNQNFDADTFFTSLTTKFDRLLNNINGSFVGIIPGYILAIMMALIFIRIISH